MSRSRHAAHGAVSDALAMSAGQAGCLAAALLFSVLVPRALGAVNYGEWMLFRGMAIFWLSLLSLGDREVISSFYVPRRAMQDHDGAGRIFKSLLLFRVALLPAGGAGVLVMLYTSQSIYRTADAAWCLSATVVLKSLQVGFGALLFGHRRLGWVAFLEGAQAVLVPLFVLTAFGDGRVAWIPRAALAADALLFAMAVLLSRWRREWRPGWLSWRALFEIVRYAAAISLATSVIISLNNLLLYLMNIRGYASAVLGWVGLSTRCAWIVQSGLIAVATALMPVLATVQTLHGAGRMLRWQNFISRLGLCLLVLAAGNVLVLGRVVVGLIWGADFALVAPLMAGSLLAVIPIWLGSQWIRQFLLQRSTRVYLQSALLYAGVLCGLFFFLPVDESGWTPVVALMGAACTLAVYSGSHAARNGASLAWLPRFLPAALWLGVAAAWMGPSEWSWALVLRALSWNLLLPLWILLPKAVEWRELVELAAGFRKR